MEPLHNYLIVAPLKKSKGLIAMEKESYEKNIGTILKLPKVTTDFKVGDRITYNGFNAHEVTFNGNIVKLVKAEDVHGIIYG